MKKLYHISLNFMEANDKPFKARIPYSTAEYENETIKRICFSDSIEGCLNLVNWTENLLIEKLILNNGKSCPIRIYEFNFNINDENLLRPKEVSKYVPDAEFFNEYWYIGEKEIYPAKSYCIEIQNTFIAEEIELRDGFIKYRYRNIEYNICEIIKPTIKDGYQVFDFNLNIYNDINKKINLETVFFMIKFKLLKMQSQLFEAIHLEEFKNRYTIKSEDIGNNKIRIKVKSPYFVLSKQNIIEQLDEYIDLK